MSQLADGVGQNERGEPEDRQELWESRSNKEEQTDKSRKKGKNEE